MRLGTIGIFFMIFFIGLYSRLELKTFFRKSAAPFEKFFLILYVQKKRKLKTKKYFWGILQL